MSDDDQPTEKGTPIQEGYQPKKEVNLGYGAKVVVDVDQRGYQPGASSGSIDSIILPQGGSVITPPQATAPLASQGQDAAAGSGASPGPPSPAPSAPEAE